ncbi:hypothetical protein BJY22_003968 [Kribbella shirazensis]|uniref:Uncharacterized protein n=1 Tax=Kribbella shirazensis TaxID=1105143 RepID=A0A7X6A1J4_9ACTN|nr:hypothetical protein [Kribbella shirazensis]
MIAFEPRKDDRPFDVAAARLGRERGVRIHEFRPAVRTDPPAPIRQALPQDLRIALAAASDVAPAHGAVGAAPQAQSSRIGPHRTGPPSREL